VDDRHAPVLRHYLRAALVRRLHHTRCAGAATPLPYRLSEAGGTVARPGRWMRRVCAGTLVHHEQTVKERVARPGRRMRNVSTGTLVRYDL
jgi:hypothetical protein